MWLAISIVSLCSFLKFLETSLAITSLMHEIECRFCFPYNSLNTWNKSSLLDATALAPSVHNPMYHLHVIVYLEVINNFKISFAIVRDRPNCEFLGLLIQLISKQHYNISWIPNVRDFFSSEHFLLHCTQDNKHRSQFGSLLFDKLLYLTELPYQIFFPCLFPLALFGDWFGKCPSNYLSSSNLGS